MQFSKSTCFYSLYVTILIFHDWSPSVLVHSHALFTTSKQNKKKLQEFLVYCIAVNVRLALFMLQTFVVTQHIKISPIIF